MLQGRLKCSIVVKDWNFLESGRLVSRYPLLTDINLLSSWENASRGRTNDNVEGQAVVLSCRNLSIRIGSGGLPPFDPCCGMGEQHAHREALDRGLRMLAQAYPRLLRLSLVDRVRATLSQGVTTEDPWSDGETTGSKSVSEERATPKGKRPEWKGECLTAADLNDGAHLPEEDTRSEVDNGEASEEDDFPIHDEDVEGIDILAQGCSEIQDLEVRQCTDRTLEAVSHFMNLQILKLVGCSPGFYYGTFSDVGLKAVAGNCHRILDLHLEGCTVGYPGLAAIASSCPLLSSLSLGGKDMKSGWLSAIPLFPSLHQFRLEGLRNIVKENGAVRAMGYCSSLRKLELHLCDVRPIPSFAALMSVCQEAKEVAFKDCWGLDDATLASIIACRSLASISVEGCSLVTTGGLEKVVLASKELQTLRVKYCASVTDGQMSSVLSEQLFGLRELKWQPDNQKSILEGLLGTGVGSKGRWLLGKAA